jgi:hypothetical protein
VPIASLAVENRFADAEMYAVEMQAIFWARERDQNFGATRRVDMALTIRFTSACRIVMLQRD